MWINPNVEWLVGDGTRFSLISASFRSRSFARQPTTIKKVRSSSQTNRKWGKKKRKHRKCKFYRQRGKTVKGDFFRPETNWGLFLSSKAIKRWWRVERKLVKRKITSSSQLYGALKRNYPIGSFFAFKVYRRKKRLFFGRKRWKRFFVLSKVNSLFSSAFFCAKTKSVLSI